MRMFYPVPIIFSGLLMSLLTTKTMFVEGSSKSRLWPIFLLFFLIRLPPVQHATGGQDQGLYFSTSEAFVNNKSFYMLDDFRASLPSQLLEFYDEYSASSISLIDSKKSEYTSDFYPAFPLFLGMCGKIFGKWNIGLGPIVLGVLFLFLLLRFLSLIGESSTFALGMVGLLLTINPPLIFFTKGTYTEVLNLFLSIYVVYHMWMAIHAVEKRHVILNLGLASMGIAVHVLNRMSFPYLMPLAGYSIFIGLSNQDRFKRGMFFFFAGVQFALFVGSLLYYKKFLTVLFETSPFANKLFLIQSLFFSAAIVAGVIGSLQFVLKNDSLRIHQKMETVRRFLQIRQNHIIKALLASTLVVLMALAVKIYFESKFGPFGFTYNNKDFGLFRYSLLYKLTLFIGPVLGIFFIDFRLKVGLFGVAVAGYILYAVILTACWTDSIPYLYYYGRYLVGDLLIAFIVMLWLVFLAQKDKGIRYRLLTGFVGLQLLYSLGFSSPQFGKSEGDDNDFFKFFEQRYPERSIFIIDDIHFDRKMIEGLRYFLGRSVFVISNFDELKKENVKLLMKKFYSGENKLYLVKSRRTSGDPVLWRYKFLSNGEHIRGGSGVQASDPSDVRLYFLPTKWKASEVGFSVHQLN
jgi:hypothetical protein